MKYGKKLIAVVITCLMVMLLVVPAAATEAQPQCGLTIEFIFEEQPLEGAIFHIYHVGDYDANGRIVLKEELAALPITPTEDLMEYAQTLYGYLNLSQTAPQWEAVIDETGHASVKDLEKGVYLVAGQSHEQEGMVYITSPQLAYLPWRESSDQDWIYDVTLVPKEAVLSQQVTQLKVLKVWEDTGNENFRPESIQVTLLCDGEAYETVTLNAETNWRYTWYELPAGCEWTVVEDVPEKYTVHQSKEGVTYVLTNTFEEPPPPTEPPGDEDIPQTGLLWWPVPVLLVLGIVLIVLSFGRKEDYNEA